MVVLIPGERLRGIFHPCNFHWHADEEPGIPNGLWQRWRLDGMGVHRENF